MKNNLFFEKTTTFIIKALALVMMQIHHFLTFPEWWPCGINYPIVEKLAIYLNASTKLCVSIFCFLTGYFYYYNKDKSLKYSLKRIIYLLISYWLVFFILAFIASVFTNYQYNVVDFLLECFALYRPTMIFCWYVYFYIIVMLILPYLTKIMSKSILYDLLLSLIIICLLTNIIVKIDPFNCVVNDYFIMVIRNVSDWIPCVLIGYIYGSNNLFEKLKSLNKRIIQNSSCNIIFLLFTSVIVFISGYAFPYIKLFNGFIEINMDLLYAPIFIYCVACLCKTIDLKWIKYALVKIGENSSLMWFISCAFFGNCESIFKPILYLPKNGVLVIVWGTLLCLFPAIILKKVSNKIINICNRFYNYLTKDNNRIA